MYDITSVVLPHSLRRFGCRCSSRLHIRLTVNQCSCSQQCSVPDVTARHGVVKCPVSVVTSSAFPIVSWHSSHQPHCTDVCSRCKRAHLVSILVLCSCAPGLDFSKQTIASYSPMTYVQPSLPTHTSCAFPAGTSKRAPGPRASLLSGSSSGYEMVSSPDRMRCVVNPSCLCGL